MDEDQWWPSILLGRMQQPDIKYNLSWRYLLNLLWAGVLCEKLGFLSSRSRSQCRLKSQKQQLCSISPELWNLWNQTWYSGASSKAGVFCGSFWLLSSWSRSQRGLKSSWNVFWMSHRSQKDCILPHKATNLVSFLPVCAFVLSFDNVPHFRLEIVNF